MVGVKVGSGMGVFVATGIAVLPVIVVPPVLAVVVGGRVLSTNKFGVFVGFKEKGVAVA